MPHPATPPRTVFGVEREHFAGMREYDANAAEGARYGPHVMSHSPTFISGVARKHRIRQSACTSNRDECHNHTPIERSQLPVLVDVAEDVDIGQPLMLQMVRDPGTMRFRNCVERRVALNL